MRGRVLLVDQANAVDPELFREAGLTVHVLQRIDGAGDQAAALDPEVIVVAGPATGFLIAALRTAADFATSIIVAGNEQDYEAARRAGADSFVGPREDLLYEIHRALILRRSGRRLPWSGPQ